MNGDGYFFCFSFSRTSPSFGKRPTCFFENTVFPSTITSKTPPLPGVRVVFAPRFCFSSAAKLEARGRYPHSVQ